MKRIPMDNLDGWNFDRFRQFTKAIGRGFYQTESGIVFVQGYRADPRDRNTTSATHNSDIVLTMPNDGVYDFYINGEKIPIAWLTQGGSPTLCIDSSFETDNVTQIYSHNLTPEVNMMVPANLGRSSAISLSEAQRLQGSPIKVSSPNKPTKEQVAWWTEAQEVAKVMEELDPTPVARWVQRQAVDRRLAAINMAPADWVASLDTPEKRGIRWHLSEKGWGDYRATNFVQHLTAKKRGT